MEKKKQQGEYILDAMAKIEKCGDSYTDIHTLYSRLETPVSYDLFRRDLQYLLAPKKLRLDGSHIYITSTLETEEKAAQLLGEILQDNALPQVSPPQPLLVNSIPLNAEQRLAVSLALSHRLSLILGGAGTGKSTLIQGILQTYGGAESTFLLAAPTGKAADNLRAKIGVSADTIHMYLKQRTFIDWDEIGLIIIDEASMLTTEVFASVLECCGENCRLVLVGDPQQLPAVGAGNVLLDLLALGTPSITLRISHRQKQAQSALAWNVENFSGIRSLDALRFDRSFRFIETADHEVADIICRGTARRYLEGLDCQLLTISGKPGRDFSAACFNQALQPMVNPQSGEPLFGGLRPGDRVIATSNNRSIGCFNGDCGTLLLPESDNESVAMAELRLDNGKSRFICSELQLQDFSLAYAITTHKSQGSEYDSVILPLPETDRGIVYRNLLYTAISRAKRQVILVGSKSTLERALRTPAKLRNSGLVRKTRASMDLIAA